MSKESEELPSAEEADMRAAQWFEEQRTLMRGQGILQSSWKGFKDSLKEASDWRSLLQTPYGFLPVLLLSIAGVFQSFDSVAVNIVLPDVRRDLELNLSSMLTMLNLVGFLMIFVTLGAGYLLDRVSRKPFVAGATIFSGVFSLAFTRGRSEVALGFSRAGDGASEKTSAIPRFSLLADYYPPEVRGKAFALFGTMSRAASFFAPLLVGYAVLQTTDDPNHPNWRLPFYVTGPALIVIGLLLLWKLKEPVRGYMERKALGADEDVARSVEESPSFAEAWRVIWGIRTLRRFFIAAIPSGIGLTIFSRFYFFFLTEEYGLNTFERSAVFALAGAFSLVGGFIGGGLVDVLTRRRPHRVLVLFGLLGVGSSIFLFLVALGLPLWVLIVSTALFGFFGALLGPAESVIFAQILPAHVRTTGLTVQVLAEIPAAIVFQVVITQLVTRFDIQAGLLAGAPFLLLGALIELSAAGLFEGDMRSALASQLATEEWRRAKSEGKGKLLVCRDVDVEYDGVQVLFGVDFDVEQGQVLALLGTNGAGKSTLLKAIAGIREASSGGIIFDGRDITHMPPNEVAARGVAYMPGGKGVFPNLTVKENLTMGLWRDENGDSSSRLEEIFALFPILRERADQRASSLSGGEQQMLALAETLLTKPRLLMIDELSLGLSPAVVAELIEVVKKINQQGTTIILVEQSVNLALTVADRAIFMEKGEIKFFGETRDLLRRPEILRAVYVKGAGALVESGPASGVKTERERRQYLLEEAATLLELRDVTKSYGGIVAVDHISFELKEGEALGLIGPNGAGKTTLFDLISGYQLLDSGAIIFEGVDVTMLRPDERAKRRLVRRFQDARLFPALTVHENLLMALDQKLEVQNAFLSVLPLPQVRQSERRIRVRAERLIELLELGAYRDKFVKELSTGLRRITDLACVLATEPRVLLLDEPSTGIAQSEAEALASLLRRVRFETGCSMLVIEHDMSLVSQISDELIALDQGRVIARGEPEKVLDDERVIESYLGTSEEAIRRSGVLE
jgi:ABC-type branched-subunit amino acid transport system ATPase component/predicted MFS family arabinose efflux permease